MRGGGAEERSALAPSRTGAFAGVLLVGALLVFTWPFVRVPAFSLVPAYLHLLGAWIVLIAALIALSRALARHGGDDADD